MKVRGGPAGWHLFDRRTGLNALVDEVPCPVDAWSAAPRHLSVALTNACDLACAFCYAPKRGAAVVRGRVEAWLAEVDAAGCLGVGFGGGEPTLSPHLPALCRYAVERTGMAVSLTTHGHHLGSDLLTRLSGAVHFVRVSVDGVGATYEAVRGRPFASLADRLPRIRDVARLGINCVVNAQTVADLSAVCELAAAVGAEEVLLLPEQPVAGRGGIDVATATRFRSWVAAYDGPVRLSVGARGADGLATCDPFATESGLRGYAHIDAHGTLKRSSYDASGAAIGSGGVIEALRALAADGAGADTRVEHG